MEDTMNNTFKLDSNLDIKATNMFAKIPILGKS